VSAVCQAALADAVERVGRTRRGIEALRDPTTPVAVLGRLAEGIRKRMTPRLVTALEAAALGADGEARTTVSSLDLLRGLLHDGENLAVRLLLAQGVDVDALAAATATIGAAEARPPVAEPNDLLVGRLTMPARLAAASALDAVLELGHNYIGCEHLLVGLSANEGKAGDLLGDHGVQAISLLHAIRGAAAGVVHERRATASSESGALADLTRRLEAVERQLGSTAAGTPRSRGSIDER
jgi:ATP-dependent Clp protease ATP-binding subunit ClpA